MIGALTSCVAVALDSESVFADGNPPDVLDGAGAFAVDTLNLVLAYLVLTFITGS